MLLRKDAAGGTDPTYDIELWESGGGSAIATLVSGATLSSETGVAVSATWDAASLGTADGSAVEVRVVGHASGDRSVEVGAVEWVATGEALAGPDLYFLRARYYDPATGRFMSRDLLEFNQRYAYVDNNPMLWTDPSGLCKFGIPCPKPVRWVRDRVKAIDEASLLMDAAALAANAGPTLIVVGTASGQPWFVAAGIGLTAVNGIASAAGAAEVGAAYRDGCISPAEAVIRGTLLLGGVLPTVSWAADGATTALDVAYPTGPRCPAKVVALAQIGGRSTVGNVPEKE